MTIPELDDERTLTPRARPKSLPEGLEASICQQNAQSQYEAAMSRRYSTSLSPKSTHAGVAQTPEKLHSAAQKELSRLDTADLDALERAEATPSLVTSPDLPRAPIRRTSGRRPLSILSSSSMNSDFSHSIDNLIETPPLGSMGPPGPMDAGRSHSRHRSMLGASIDCRSPPSYSGNGAFPAYQYNQSGYAGFPSPGYNPGFSPTEIHPGYQSPTHLQPQLQPLQPQHSPQHSPHLQQPPHLQQAHLQHLQTQQAHLQQAHLQAHLQAQQAPHLQAHLQAQPHLQAHQAHLQAHQAHLDQAQLQAEQLQTHPGIPEYRESYDYPYGYGGYFDYAQSAMPYLNANQAANVFFEPLSPQKEFGIEHTQALIHAANEGIQDVFVTLAYKERQVLDAKQMWEFAKDDLDNFRQQVDEMLKPERGSISLPIRPSVISRRHLPNVGIYSLQYTQVPGDESFASRADTRAPSFNLAFSRQRPAAASSPVLRPRVVSWKIDNEVPSSQQPANMDVISDGAPRIARKGGIAYHFVKCLLGIVHCIITTLPVHQRDIYYRHDNMVYIPEYPMPMEALFGHLIDASEEL